MQTNTDIRQALAGAGMKQWQLADCLMVSESYLCRKLRRELSREDKEKIFAVIECFRTEVNAWETKN